MKKLAATVAAGCALLAGAATMPAHANDVALSSEHQTGHESGITTYPVSGEVSADLAKPEFNPLARPTVTVSDVKGKAAVVASAYITVPAHTNLCLTTTSTVGSLVVGTDNTTTTGTALSTTERCTAPSEVQARLFINAVAPANAEAGAYGGTVAAKYYAN